MTDYRVVQKVIHWLMALIIGIDLFVAQKFGRAMEDWDRLESRADHSSVGMVVLFLFLLRLFFRLRYGAAALPAGMSNWQVFLAKGTHIGFYLCIALLLGTGILTAVNATDPIAVFGQLDITLGQTSDDIFLLIRPVHEFATNAIIALIALHVAAALYHHFIIKDDSTIRMLKFWKSNA